MGIIQRQSIKRSIVAYGGVAIGAVSTMFIYPLELEVYGLAQFLLSLALVLAPLSTLGIRTLTIRFFPHFVDETRRHSGFLTFLCVASLVSFSVFAVLMYFLQEPIYALIARWDFNVAVYRDNLGTIATLTFLFIFTDLFTSFASNFRRVVIPELFNTLFIKLGLPVLILIYCLAYINWEDFKLGMVFIYGLVLIAAVSYLKWLGHLHFAPIDSKLKTGKMRYQMASYAVYGTLTLLGSMLAFKIDSIMVTSLIGGYDNGVNTIAQFVTNTLVIPFASINLIASPILASNWKANNLAEIQSIYQKSSLNLLLIGGLLLGGILLTMDFLFQLSPRYEELALAEPVILVLGIAKLIDMTFGVNDQIISYSRHYHFNLYAVLLLAGANIYLNFQLIPTYGIIGAAIATAISLGLFNLSKFLFIWFRFGLQPFSWRTLASIGIVGTAYFLVSLLPVLPSALLNVLLTGTTFVVLTVFPILALRLSPDINGLVIKYWRVVLRKKG